MVSASVDHKILCMLKQIHVHVAGTQWEAVFRIIFLNSRMQGTFCITLVSDVKVYIDY